MNSDTIKNTPSQGRAGVGLTIIAIIGPSGAGKDTFARLLAERTPYELIVSYTTRPLRQNEVNGREHHFVNECTLPQVQMLAYTEYGGYEYWVPLPCDQSQGVFIYVIDEEGVRSISERFPNIKIIKILVTANRDIRKMRGVTEERMQRDQQRKQFPLESFQFIIRNNKSLKALKHHVIETALKLRKIITPQ